MKPRKKRNRRPKYKERVCQGFLLLQQNNRTWRKCKTKTKKKQKAGSYGKILLSCITLIREVSLNKHFCFLYYFSFQVDVTQKTHTLFLCQRTRTPFLHTPSPCFPCLQACKSGHSFPMQGLNSNFVMKLVETIYFQIYESDQNWADHAVAFICWDVIMNQWSIVFYLQPEIVITEKCLWFLYVWHCSICA